MRTGGIARERNGPCSIRTVPRPGWSSSVPSPRERRCGSASWSSGRIIIAAGTPAACSRSITLARRERARPVAQPAVEQLTVGDALARRWRTPVAQPDPPRTRRSACHWASSRDRDDAPLVVAGARIDAPRRAGVAAALAERRRKEDVGELVEDQLGLGDSRGTRRARCGGAGSGPPAPPSRTRARRSGRGRSSSARRTRARRRDSARGWRRPRRSARSGRSRATRSTARWTRARSCSASRRPG